MVLQRSSNNNICHFIHYIRGNTSFQQHLQTYQMTNKSKLEKSLKISEWYSRVIRYNGVCCVCTRVRLYGKSFIQALVGTHFWILVKEARLCEINARLGQRTTEKKNYGKNEIISCKQHSFSKIRSNRILWWFYVFSYRLILFSTEVNRLWITS